MYACKEGLTCTLSVQKSFVILSIWLKLKLNDPPFEHLSEPQWDVKGRCCETEAGFQGKNVAAEIIFFRHVLDSFPGEGANFVEKSWSLDTRHLRCSPAAHLLLPCETWLKTKTMYHENGAAWYLVEWRDLFKFVCALGWKNACRGERKVYKTKLLSTTVQIELQCHDERHQVQPHFALADKQGKIGYVAPKMGNRRLGVSGLLGLERCVWYSVSRK